MKILGIDPGPKSSAYALFDCSPFKMVECGVLPNESLFERLRPKDGWNDASRVVIERITPRSAGVGRDVFDTAEWAGTFRGVFASLFGLDATSMPTRPAICAWATGSSRASKPQVRAGIADLWSMTPREVYAKGGPLEGLPAPTKSPHEWDAAALALWWLLTEGGYELVDERGIARRGG